MSEKRNLFDDDDDDEEYKPSETAASSVPAGEQNTDGGMADVNLAGLGNEEQKEAGYD